MLIAAKNVIRSNMAITPRVVALESAIDGVSSRLFTFNGLNPSQSRPSFKTQCEFKLILLDPESLNPSQSRPSFKTPHCWNVK